MPKNESVTATLVVQYESIADCIGAAQELYDRATEQGAVVSFETKIENPTTINLLDSIS